MPIINKLFTGHPATVGESYSEHLATASSFGIRMVLGGIACLVHGFIPCLFERTGSNQVRALHDRMVTHRVRGSAAGPTGAN